ncbi:MAG TPA: hypothetical protein VJX68_08355 [Candidatus Binatus sp.]|uniref:hypothetical protein n=1 Tax=Candidatus Binatus sp. TaxID=2811406 RepID=UPI002B4813DD|nr:hypothetical protein [Candidatus Binatus sp.]HKN13194.1 hypothetical protein [Candidatus Binatus sp.]
MAVENNDDPIEAMIAPRAPRRAPQAAVPATPAETPAEKLTTEQNVPPEKPKPEPREPHSPALRPPTYSQIEGRLEVRPIGTPMGLRELAALHKRTWKMLNVQEKRVHMLLWPLAIHFGLYAVSPGSERRRPPLIGAFWARCLAEAPLTLGHLYPAQLFKGLLASEVFEFGGMVIDPTYQGKGLVKMMSDTARLFVFSRRPKLLITNPVEPLYEMYKQLGLKTVGREPVEHPHAFNVRVWLMYGKFDEMSKPYFM